MKITTLCYIENEHQVLMLHRVKKDQDPNQGKWIGVGGKLESNESPKDCILREIKEETGVEVSNLILRGIVTFILPKWENELTFVYTATCAGGELKLCEEGDLKWVNKSEVMKLNLWEGDRCFVPLLLEGHEFFSMKLIYDECDRFLSCVIEE